MDSNFNLAEFSEQLKKEAEKMQTNLQETQQELENLRVVGKSGGGMVAIEMNGRHDVLSVKLNNALHDEDFKMLEDLIAAAINDAVKQVETISQEKIAKLTSGLGNMGNFIEEDK